MRKLFALILLAPLAVTGQKDYRTKLDTYMQAQANINEFSGNVLVARKGKIIYEKAFGLADREWNIANTVQGKFQIASITKQFTAACILQLAEQGKLSLEDKLSKYFPGFPKGDSVTIHMLLNHTSGILGYIVPEFTKLWTPLTKIDSVVSFLQNKPYLFPPGTAFSYNNTAYYLLGYIIEKASSLSFKSYLHQNIISKAKLINTSFYDEDSIITYRVKGYIRNDSGWKNTTIIPVKNMYSAGGLISTLNDLYRWHLVLFGGKIISAASLSKMTTPGLRKYGYGLYIDSFQNHRRFWHTGTNSGFRSYITFYPDDDINIIILSNRQDLVPATIAHPLAAILFENPVEVPNKRKEVAVDVTILQRYATENKYQQPDLSISVFIVKEGKLYIDNTTISNTKTSRVMKAESETKFFIGELPHIQFKFEVNKAGKIVKCYIIESGIRSEIKKL